jgi:hypothetical protein
MSVIEHGPWGVSWTCEEPMERSSHALADGERVWLFDPVADDEGLDAARRHGEVAGVLQLLDRHPRDCAQLARRYGVDHQRLPERLSGTPFESLRVVWLPCWREVCLWWSARPALVVPEAIGTATYFSLGDTPAGIHPFLRALPPGRAMSAHEPEHLLVGHGPPLREGATTAIAQALQRSRRDLPRAAAAVAKGLRVGR